MRTKKSKFMIRTSFLTNLNTTTDGFVHVLHFNFVVCRTWQKQMLLILQTFVCYDSFQIYWAKAQSICAGNMCSTADIVICFHVFHAFVLYFSCKEGLLSLMKSSVACLQPHFCDVSVSPSLARASLCSDIF